MKIHIGNLSFETTSAQLRTEFEAFGKVDSAEVITDRVTGRSKGFAFVEMPSVTEAQAAIAGLNGKTVNDRTLDVGPARPRSDDRGGSFRGGNRGGYNRGGRRY